MTTSRACLALLVLALAACFCAAAPAPLPRRDRLPAWRVRLLWHSTQWDVRLTRAGAYRASWGQQVWVGSWRWQDGRVRVEERIEGGEASCEWLAPVGGSAPVRIEPGGGP